MQSSSLYTFQKPVGGKRKYVASTIVLSVLSLAGAVAIDLHLNPTAVSTIMGSTTTGSKTGTTSGTGTGTGSGKGTGTVTPPAAKSATGDPINYFYGTIQVKVTKTSGKITAVDLVQAQATNGRETAFPTLVQAAISSNGSNFGNLGGATYTTDAFKQALDSAVSKLG